MQESGDDAIVYGAYATARQVCDQAITSRIRNPVVVLDIDEAILDNSAYETWLLALSRLDKYGSGV